MPEARCTELRGTSPGGECPVVVGLSGQNTESLAMDHSAELFGETPHSMQYKDPFYILID